MLRRGRLRVVDPVRLARRVAIGIGLAEVRELEQRVAALAEAVEENAHLGRLLASRVGRLEHDLVPLLELRARRARPGAGA